MDLGFGGKRAVVTGGTGALGTAVVGRLLEAGVEVWIPVFDSRELTAFPYGDHSSVHTVEGVDLTAPAAVDAFYGAIPDLAASIHIAGGFAFTPLEALTPAVLEGQYRMNALTATLCCQAAVDRMAEGGQLLNVTARPALEPSGGPQLGAYTMAKAAVAALTRSLASELRPRGIGVNAIAPSVIDTAVNREAMPDADWSSWVKPEDAADVIVFLASPRNRVVSGACVPVYGNA